MIEIKKILLALFCLVLPVNANNAGALFDTTPPTVAPGTGETPAPSSAYNATSSVAPTTSAPSSAATTAAPSSHATSSAPSVRGTTGSPAPSLHTATSVPSAHATTAAPSNATSVAPSSSITPAPSTSPPNSPSSAAPSTSAPSKHYTPPSVAPSSSIVPPPSPRKGGGAAKIIGKTIGWLILIALTTLAFGAIMSNRYRIYYVVRGIWYSFLSLDCTRRLMTLLRIDGGPAASASLNEIIFDQNDLAEGLLMGDQ